MPNHNRILRVSSEGSICYYMMNGYVVTFIKKLKVHFHSSFIQ